MSLTRRSVGSLSRPRVTATATCHSNGQRAQAATVGNHQDTAAGAATAAAIVISAGTRSAICGNRARSSDRAGANQDHAAALATAAGSSARVVTRSSAAAATEYETINCSNIERRAAIAADGEIARPRVTTVAARAAIAATATATVLIVR